MTFNQLVRAIHSDSAAAGAQVDTYLFVADAHYEVREVRANFRVLGTSATLDIKKCPSGTAIGSGASVLLTTFDLAGTAAIPLIRSRAANTLTATKADRLLAPGDSLALDFGGTLTGLLGVVVQVVLEPTRKNN